MAITIEEVGDRLRGTLTPYIKGFPNEGGMPDFRKKLSGEEVEAIFTSIFSIAKEIGETNESS